MSNYLQNLMEMQGSMAIRRKFSTVGKRVFNVPNVSHIAKNNTFRALKVVSKQSFNIFNNQRFEERCDEYLL